MAATDLARTRRAPVIDKLGVLIALIIAVAWVLLPFATFKANRIVQGQPRIIYEALPAMEAGLVALIVGVSLPVIFYRTPTLWRLLTSAVALAALLFFIGRTAPFLTPPGNTLARISPGAGFWVLLFGYLLLAADALTRLRLKPLPRIGVLLLAAVALALLMLSGDWNGLSILKEYFVRADAFWREGLTHVILAFGSLFAAIVVGVPLGVLCYRVPRLRTIVLNILNGIQTIPSIALFGLLIAPLAWIAANVPGAAAIGVSGIGFTPAIVALFIYSLLPVVANTVVGLLGVPPAADDAARGMGMTDNQRLFQVEMPLAFPVILTGIRIVLVQNIGLATVAALIGGGGFGVFVFQGIGQTALDLVLLGAVPTVVLAFAAAIVLDALVEMTSVKGREN
ncbi:MAG TPA: ABC transporter permease [Devosiaceae bacterium]|nr:ABC transporter permease [Devosiaceae bacterium]